jgi:hypothetical protein
MPERPSRITCLPSGKSLAGITSERLSHDNSIVSPDARVVLALALESDGCMSSSTLKYGSKAIFSPMNVRFSLDVVVPPVSPILTRERGVCGQQIQVKQIWVSSRQKCVNLLTKYKVNLPSKHPRSCDGFVPPCSDLWACIPWRIVRWQTFPSELLLSVRIHHRSSEDRIYS